jgi:DNA-binding NarL/FixJ family response regulator
MKVLVADDHALFRSGVHQLLEQLDDDVVVVEACDFQEALRSASEHADINLVLLDLNMPGVGGLDALAVLGERYPTFPVVVLSASEDHGDMRRALEAGALGFIPKTASVPVMLNALRLVMSGGIYVPPELVNGPCPTEDAAPSAGVHPAGAANAAGKLDLTRRQLDVLSLLVRGETNKEIARELHMAEATVKVHLTAIFRALNVHNRTQAVLAAERFGLRSNGGKPGQPVK